MKEKEGRGRVYFSKCSLMNQAAILMWLFLRYEPESNPWRSSVIFAPKSKGISKCLEVMEHQKILEGSLERTQRRQRHFCKVTASEL